MVDVLQDYVDEQDETGKAEELGRYLEKMADDYGFEDVEYFAMDVPAIRSSNCETLEVDPRIFISNPLTYLRPDLMETKIETRVQTIRGFYQDPHYGLEEEKKSEEATSEVPKPIMEAEKEMSEKKRQLITEDNPFKKGELARRIDEIQKGLDDWEQKMDWYDSAGIGQAKLFMINEQNSKEPVKSPERALAIDSYQPGFYQLDEQTLKSELDRYFETMHWLNPNKQEQVVEEVQRINEELEQATELLEATREN